jgi:hypothetical protein
VLIAILGAAQAYTAIANHPVTQQIANGMHFQASEAYQEDI